MLAASIDDPSANWALDDLPYIIGALSFLGRVEEAELRAAKLGSNAEQHAASHFYLSVGWIRCSSYQKARFHIIKCFKLAHASLHRSNPMVRFYALQSLAFYRYFSARFPLALRSAERALGAAIEADHFFARMLATDLLGHARIERGEIARGISELELAHRFAWKLGHGSNAKAIYRALISYKAQFGLIPEDVLHALNEVIQASKVQDTYTDNYMILELVRQLCLRARLSDAEEWLNKVSRTIYANRHRRQIMLLNLRWADIALHRGDMVLFREKMDRAQLEIDPEIDKSFVLHWQGLALKSKLSDLSVADTEHKLLTEQVGSGLALRMMARENNLTHPVAPGDDPFGDLMDDLLKPSGFHIDLIQKVIATGYLGLLTQLLPQVNSRQVIYLNIMPGMLIINRNGDIHVCDTGTSTKVQDLLRALQRGFKSKEDLVKSIWGYEYNSLRHDSLLYTLVSRLRTSLGSCGSWIENQDEGYKLKNGIYVHWNEVQPDYERTSIEMSSAEGQEQWNVRQLSILEYLRKQKHWIVPEDCVELFKTSKVTATRDLSSLVKGGLIQRVGRGKATRYGLPDCTQV